MCLLVHVDDLREEARALLEEYAEGDIVTVIDADQCEKSWERSVHEFADYADLCDTLGNNSSPSGHKGFSEPDALFHFN